MFFQKEFQTYYVNIQLNAKYIDFTLFYSFLKFLIKKINTLNGVLLNMTFTKTFLGNVKEKKWKKFYIKRTKFNKTIKQNKKFLKKTPFITINKLKQTKNFYQKNAERKFKYLNSHFIFKNNFLIINPLSIITLTLKINTNLLQELIYNVKMQTFIKKIQVIKEKV